MELAVEHATRVNYAMDQNGVRAVHSVTVRHDGADDVCDLVLRVTTEPSVTRPFERRLDVVRAGSELCLRDVDVRLDTAVLAARTESERGRLVVELRPVEAADDVEVADEGDPPVEEPAPEPLARYEAPLDVLARNVWPGEDAPPELLAAFVAPNDPAVAELLREATDVQQSRGWRVGLDGYQSGTRERVVELAGAIYGAVCNRDVRYSAPPASFERTGQKVRLPTDVFATGLATCLDTTLLFAACLEQAGLHPLVVLHQDHAYVGVWLDEATLPDAATDSESALVNRVDLGAIAVFETTVVTQESPAEFAEARRLARARLEDGSFRLLVDVTASRAVGVRPANTEPGDGEALDAARRVDRATDDLGRVRPRHEVVDEATEDTVARIERWKAELLDLTFRNSLLAFRETKGTLPLLVPDLGEFEDVLAGGTRLALRSAEGLKGLGEPEQIDEGVLRRELGANRVVTSVSQAELERRALQIYRESRSALEETGSNVLFLALGFLRWFESSASEKERRSPLLLVPLEITRKSVSSGFRIRLLDDEARFNVTLLQKLERDFGLSIPGLDPLPEDANGVDLAAVLAAVRHAILDQDRWTVSEEAWIGRFSFQKFLMWLDLAEHADRLAQSPVVRRLMGRGDGSERLSGDLPRPSELDDATEPHDFLCPMEADSSQLAAIHAASTGRSLVLQGPPGTGKSQTITNLIAHCMGQGKRVLFVSEKRAALDVVFRRLESQGLAPFCLALHSNKATKRSVLDQIETALDVAARRTPEDWEQRGHEVAELRARLNDYCDALHRERSIGHSLHDGLSELMALRDVAEVALELDEPTALTRDDAEAFQQTARSLVRGAREAELHPEHPLIGVSIDRWTVELPGQVRAACEELRSAAQAWDDALATAREDLALPERAPGETGDAAETLRELLAESPRPPRAVLERSDLDRVAADLRDAFDIGSRRDAARAVLDGRYSPEFWDLPHAELRRDVEAARRSNFLLRWWRLRGIRKRIGACRRDALPPDEVLFEDPGRALDVLELDRELDARAETARGALGEAWRPDAGVWDELGCLLDWALRFHELVASVSGDDLDLRGRLRQRWATLATEGADLVREGGAIEARTARLVPLRAAFDGATARWRELTGVSLVPRDVDGLEAVQVDAQRVSDAAGELRSWAEWSRARKDAVRLRLSPVARAIESGELPLDAVPDVVRRGVLIAWTRAVASSERALSDFHGSRHASLIDEFRRKDRKLAVLARELVQARLAARVPRGDLDSTSDDSEMGILRRELKKKRRHRAIRRLLSETRHVLARIKPCFLMSPLSIAQYLPPDAEPFDLVVFDEASQIPVCDGVGAIARGQSVVVVGDSKQLPPTRFFTTQEADEPDTDDLHDLESILDECVAARLPTATLDWHYRSRHEHLITFSNQRYYDGRLHTFPSSEYEGSRLGVDWHHVPGGVYERGGSATNPAEARALVEHLVRHLSDPATRERSVGVVTFSSQQQRCVEDLLEAARREHDAIEPYFDDTRDEPVFVKNLENVQGDERDVILFSVGYGPDASGKVSMNFGPLNRIGGERRLNVAVTRARERVEVFSTLRPEQIDLRRTQREGVRDLKTFLEYAQRGPIAILAESLAPTDGRPESPFEQEVYDALRAEGFEVHPQVGCSGYRIDLGVVHPEQPGRYVVGIECDGAMYHSAKSARDRDRLRAAVLGSLGWRLHRIWSTDWWLEPEKETRRAVQAIRTAIEAADAALPPTVEEPAAVEEPVLVATEPAPPASSNPPTYAVQPIEAGIHAEDDVRLQAQRARLTELLDEVARTEAPVCRDLLWRRVLLAYDVDRLSERVRNALNEAMANTAELVVRPEKDGTQIVWLADQDPETWSVYRAPDGSDPETERSADQIPVAELAAALVDVLRNEISLTEEALIRAGARAFGISRVGSRVTARMTLAVDELVSSGRATRDDGWVRCSG